MLLMARRQASFFIVLFFISQLFRDNASQQCGAGGDLYSIYQMMLKGHTYKSFKTAPGTLECREACLADVKCQSYNVVMFIAICELNYRSKEARPEDFVKNKDRYYMAKGPKRVADYCVKHQCQNDAKCVNRDTNYTCVCNSSGWTGKYCEKGHSCKEIRDASSHLKDGEYWIALKKNGSLLKVYCDMTTDGGGWLLVSNVVVGNLSSLLFSYESSYHEISNYHKKSFLITADAMKELRTHFSFTQLRFHCSKNKGRTFHLTTAANSSGEAVVQYFSGQTDAFPKACGSFVRMKDDNSKLAADCSQWSGKTWGNSYKGQNRYRVVAYVSGKYHWLLYGSSRWECDDYISNGEKYFGLSTGDFWRVFVR